MTCLRFDGRIFPNILLKGIPVGSWLVVLGWLNVFNRLPLLPFLLRRFLNYRSFFCIWGWKLELLQILIISLSEHTFSFNLRNVQWFDLMTDDWLRIFLNFLIQSRRAFVFRRVQASIVCLNRLVARVSLFSFDFTNHRNHWIMGYYELMRLLLLLLQTWAVNWVLRLNWPSFCLDMRQLWDLVFPLNSQLIFCILLQFKHVCLHVVVIDFKMVKFSSLSFSLIFDCYDRVFFQHWFILNSSDRIQALITSACPDIHPGVCPRRQKAGVVGRSTHDLI